MVIVNITPDTAWSPDTEIDLATVKEDDLSLKLEPDDNPCDDNKEDDEMVLQILHCNDCDVVLYDRESMRYHLKRHQHLGKQTIGGNEHEHLGNQRLYNYTGNRNRDLVENGLNESVPTADTEM